jgi:hypothetical protein
VGPKRCRSPGPIRAAACVPERTDGANWSHNWQSTLSVDDTGTVTVSAGDGGGGGPPSSRQAPAPGCDSIQPTPAITARVEFNSNASTRLLLRRSAYRHHFEKPAGIKLRLPVAVGRGTPAATG